MNTSRTFAPAWLYAITAMFAVQLCSALSTHIINEVGATGVAWLRMTFAAILMMILTRPPLRSIRGSDILPLLGFATTTALMTICFLQAIDRIPLGTAVAIEFLGPLTIAALHNRNLSGWTWTGLAFLGVILLNRPWQGEINLIGIGYASAAALGWALYIVFTQLVGDRFDGVSSLALILPVAAIITAPLGFPSVAQNFSWSVIATAILLAALNPALTFTFEMIALKRMNAGAYGVLASLEPGIGALIGGIFLHERLDLAQMVGLLFVLVAGVASQR